MWRVAHVLTRLSKLFPEISETFICVHHRHYYIARHLAIHSFRLLPRSLVSRLSWRYIPILPVDRTSTCPDFWPTGNHAVTIVLATLAIVTDHYFIPWQGLNSRRSECHLPSSWIVNVSHYIQVINVCEYCCIYTWSSYMRCTCKYIIFTL